MQEIRRQLNSKNINRHYALRRITRKNLDLEKYSACLSNAINYRIYAEYWYLDTLVGENWACYVLNDYEAIMPIPFVKKLGIKLIFQPIYCQQLGVFHSENFSKEVFHQFEKKLHRNLVRSYHFNEENTVMFSPKGKHRVNQVLDISTSYGELYKNFNSNRKRNIKSFQKNNTNYFFIKKNQYNIVWFLDKLNMYYEYASYIDSRVFKELIKNNLQRRNIDEYSLFDGEGRVMSSVFILHSKKRRILFSSVRDKEIEVKNSFTYLMSEILRENSENNILFDFEGSMIDSINQFFKGFGTEEKKYTNYSNISIHIITCFRFLKKILK